MSGDGGTGRNGLQGLLIRGIGMPHCRHYAARDKQLDRRDGARELGRDGDHPNMPGARVQ